MFYSAELRAGEVHQGGRLRAEADHAEEEGASHRGLRSQEFQSHRAVIASQ